MDARDAARVATGTLFCAFVWGVQGYFRGDAVTGTLVGAAVGAFSTSLTLLTAKGRIRDRAQARAARQRAHELWEAEVRARQEQADRYRDRRGGSTSGGSDQG